MATQDAVSARARANPVLALARIGALLAWTIYCYVLYAFGLVFRRYSATTLDLRCEGTQRWLWGGARVAGIRVIHSTGKIPTDPVLLAPNHTGYLDVIALGSLLPVFFVAKMEVESWPLMGFLFKSSSQIGVSRRGAVGLKDVTGAIAQRLRDGHSVCAFLEGTSTGGDRVLPFRSPLIQAAIDAGVQIVPVTLRWYSDRDGISVADDVAYWKDHSFGPHLWRLLGLTGVCVEIAFGTPLASPGCDRKTLAGDLERHVRNTLLKSAE